ncbi:MAG TPA: hypothetical protein VFE53_15715 [Mucilaginibacter sp.]|jgi:hypothetical protein|nr:hypothetical protein [Mucilaginibacter sp.]
MKYIYFMIAICLLLVITACKKTISGGSLAPLTPSIKANWGIVVDSTTNSLGNVLVTNVYTGVPGDYFDLRSDGKCYVKEGSVYDTLYYQVLTNTTINLPGHGFNEDNSPSHIITLTAHNATIICAVLLTPDGAVFRKIYLQR